MAKKDNNVNQIETDIKAVAKAVTASLKRQGHPVPHSVVLNAMSASLNRRDWHKLKVAVAGKDVAASGAASVREEPFEAMWNKLSDQDKFWAAIAGAQGVCFARSTEGWASQVVIAGKAVKGSTPSETLAAAARNAMTEFNLDTRFSATLVRGNEELGGAVFHFLGQQGRFTDFNPRMERAAASLAYPVNARARIKLGTVELEFAAYGSSKDNWYFPSGGERQLWEQVVESVDFRSILGFPVQRLDEGVGVTAKFWSDDHVYEVSFDVSAALHASVDDHLERILWMGTSDNDCVDALAVEMREMVPELAEGLNYVWHLRNQGRTMGFGCRIDIREFRRWMDANRRIVLARWFCHEEGVTLKTRQSNSGESFYDWVKTPTPGGSEVKGWDFPSEEAAMLDAYDKLGRQRGFIDSI